MFLTRVLFGKRIPGKQWIGKNRRPRFVTHLMKANMIKRLEIEAENIYWLSCPYMTKEQEYRHDEENVLMLKQQRIAEERAKFLEHKYVAENLKHLNVTKRWAGS
ncbi:PREDICTED: ribosomal protein 63, mitochondrial [Thamnophis sirtalis]|uniref:Ribosomal protein 63, mitochondrial n=1 Tax=Thamnophis sirtalis TaxID=35019 RepID=A0A6I9XPQ0_9SAUR|nr:PREDICTED: ribosomal protein 63, mitochondrial [Thamnophis sirtalis]XP_032075811.1 ribosomal protein 63, mitochondrial [Thamnophis elegans]